MKLIIVLLATIAVASAGTVQLRDALQLRDGQTRSAASELVKIIESIRDQMPCGFEKYNIPPLAPLKIEHKEVAVHAETVSVDGEVNKAEIAHLNEFEIPVMKVNVVLSKVTFTLQWDKIVVKGLYAMEAILKSYGVTVDIVGAGDMMMAIKDLTVQGTVKYSLGVLTNQVKLKEVKIVVTVGDVDSDIQGLFGKGFINRKMNEVVEEFILLAINDNQEFVTKTIEDAVVPTVNNAVEGMSLTDIIAAIGGGDSEPTVCDPSQYS